MTASVAHQAAGRGELAILEDRGHRVAERQCGELFAPAVEEWHRCRSRARLLAVGPRSQRPYRNRVRCSHAGHGVAARGCGPPPAGLAIGSRRLGLVGLTSTAMMVAVGTSSCSSSSRFGPSSTSKTVTPVRLPPGRFRLATSPSSTGSLPSQEDDRNRRGRRLCRERRRRRQSRQSRPPGGEPDRPPLPAVDRIGHPPSDIRSPRSGPRHSRFRSGPWRNARTWCADRIRRRAVEEPDHRHRRLLRARRERPRDRRAAEQRDELAPPHACP